MDYSFSDKKYKGKDECKPQSAKIIEKTDIITERQLNKDIKKQEDITPKTHSTENNNPSNPLRIF
jgi:hypothetical protein